MNRCYVLYVVMALILLVSVDHRKVIFKTLDYLGQVPSRTRDYAVNQEKEFPDYLSYDAIRYYKNYIRLFPQSAAARAALGFCYYHSGEYRRAARYYAQAAALDPQLFGLKYNLGVIFYRQGQYQKAIEVFNGAVTTAPLNTATYPGVVIPDDQDFSTASGDNYKEKIIHGVQSAYINAYKLTILSKQALDKNKNLLREGKKLDLSGALSRLIYYPPLVSKEDLIKIYRK